METTEARQDRKARIKEIRQKLANLTPEQRQQILNTYSIATVDGHVLSGHNTIMLYFQAVNRTIPTVVGGYRQWQAAGKQVMKGEHGSAILFPVGSKDDDGELLEVEHYYTAIVFDITQVEDIEGVN